VLGGWQHGVDYRYIRSKEGFIKITWREAPSGRLEPDIPRNYPINSNSKALLILKANKVWTA
jgi:hypothetical protein